MSSYLKSDWWDERYRDGDTPWDLGEPAGPFREALERGEVRPPGRVLVPGCGRGQDALLFAERGFEVTGFDFSTRAVEAARAKTAGLKARFEQEDLFHLPGGWEGRFDLVVEHTCLVAIDPSRRAEYVSTLRRLLVPGGHLLGLFFPMRWDPGGPPFPVSEADVEDYFAGSFELLWKRRPESSAASRRGNEFLAFFRTTTPLPTGERAG